METIDNLSCDCEKVHLTTGLNSIFHQKLYKCCFGTRVLKPGISAYLRQKAVSPHRCVRSTHNHTLLLLLYLTLYVNRS